MKQCSGMTKNNKMYNQRVKSPFICRLLSVNVSEMKSRFYTKTGFHAVATFTRSSLTFTEEIHAV